jgi:phage tail sheath protein FI
MAPTYTTPGVYIEEISKLPPSIAAVETAIPAFIGYTRKAVDRSGNDLTKKPTRIKSLLEYEESFGEPQPETNINVTIVESTDADDRTTSLNVMANVKPDERSFYLMHYALQMYFTNGGGPCYIVSVGPYAGFQSPLNRADLKDGLDAIEKKDEPTLIVFPESQRLPIADYRSLHEDALAQCEKLKDRFVIMDLHGGDAVEMGDSDLDLAAAVETFRKEGKDNLKYGAVYAPNVETVLDLEYGDDANVKVKRTVTKTEADGSETISETTPTLGDLKGLDNRLYEMSKAAIRDFPCVLPPSGAIAGLYARVDSERGVWKAPANYNLRGVIRPTVDVTHDEQGGMNVDPSTGKSVNVIRAFTGKGTLVWGARTLAGNDNEWRYINVRRFFNMVEESTKKAVDAFTFEPNDANTWVRVQGMIENFLTTQWRQGALQGIKPEHAFYVAVGLGKTMTALDILEGRMIVEIGMAVVRPAEFIVLRFSHMMAES